MQYSSIENSHRAEAAGSALERVRIETQALRHLKAVLQGDLDLEADAQLIADLAEGETQIFEAVDILLAADLEDESRLEGLRFASAQIDARAQRIGERRRHRRVVLESAMRELQVRKLERPLATLSLASRAPCLQVIDEALIPTRFFVNRPQLDRKAVKAALDSGERVPGADLEPGVQSLTVRRK